MVAELTELEPGEGHLVEPGGLVPADQMPDRGPGPGGGGAHAGVGPGPVPGRTSRRARRQIPCGPAGAASTARKATTAG